jgi:cytidylate kinase
MISSVRSTGESTIFTASHLFANYQDTGAVYKRCRTIPLKSNTWNDHHLTVSCVHSAQLDFTAWKAQRN